jgi:hypothetical protein
MGAGASARPESELVVADFTEDFSKPRDIATDISTIEQAEAALSRYAHLLGPPFREGLLRSAKDVIGRVRQAAHDANSVQFDHAAFNYLIRDAEALEEQIDLNKLLDFDEPAPFSREGRQQFIKEKKQEKEAAVRAHKFKLASALHNEIKELVEIDQQRGHSYSENYTLLVQINKATKLVAQLKAHLQKLKPQIKKALEGADYARVGGTTKTASAAELKVRQKRAEQVRHPLLLWLTRYVPTRPERTKLAAAVAAAAAATAAVEAQIHVRTVTYTMKEAASIAASMAVRAAAYAEKIFAPGAALATAAAAAHAAVVHAHYMVFDCAMHALNSSLNSMHEAESIAQQMANRAAESAANSLTSLYVHCGEELAMWKKEAAEKKGEESTTVSGGDEGGFEIIGLAEQFVEEQLGLDAILATDPALKHSMLDGEDGQQLTHVQMHQNHVRAGKERWENQVLLGQKGKQLAKLKSLQRYEEAEQLQQEIYALEKELDHGRHLGADVREKRGDAAAAMHLRNIPVATELNQTLRVSTEKLKTNLKVAFACSDFKRVEVLQELRARAESARSSLLLFLTRYAMDKPRREALAKEVAASVARAAKESARIAAGGVAQHISTTT